MRFESSFSFYYQRARQSKRASLRVIILRVCLSSRESVDSHRPMHFPQFHLYEKEKRQFPFSSVSFLFYRFNDNIFNPTTLPPVLSSPLPIYYKLELFMRVIQKLAIPSKLNMNYELSLSPLSGRNRHFISN